jgi:hypothetical protein
MRKRTKRLFAFILAIVITFSNLTFEKKSVTVNAATSHEIYQQSDSKWANYSYGRGGEKTNNIVNKGCGVLAIVNAATYLTGQFLNPKTVADWAMKSGQYCYGVGSYFTIAKNAASKFGKEYGFALCKYYDITSNVSTRTLTCTDGNKCNGFPNTKDNMKTVWKELTTHLKEGDTCITLVPHHFIAIVDYNESTDKVLVYDSYACNKRGTSKLASSSTNWKSMDELWAGSSSGKKCLKIRSMLTFYKYTGIKNYTVKASYTSTYNTASISAKLSPTASASVCKYFITDSRDKLKNIDATKTSNQKTTSNYECKTADKSGKFTINTYKEKKLVPGKSYYIKVAFYVGNKWYASDLITVTPSDVKPGKPSISITSKNNTIGVGGTSEISWNKCTNTDSYTVEITNDTTQEVNTYNTTGTVYSFESELFDSVGTYSVKVTAKNAKYSQESSTATITVRKNIEVVFYDPVGEVVVDSQSIPYGKSAKQPPAPSQEGYTFVKWDSSITNLRPSDENQPYKVNAVYSLNSYKVKFVDGLTGETIGKTQMVEYGSSATAPDVPEHNYYNFVQWDKDYSNIKGDTTITAVYQWYDKNYALAINKDGISAERSKDSKEDLVGYEVSVPVQNPNDEKIQGRLVIALHSSTGLLLTTTESMAFNIPANTTTEFSVFVPYDALAGHLTVYVVNNYDDAGVIAEPQEYNIKNSDWSEWIAYTDICPVQKTADIDVETDTKPVNQYQYRIKTTTTSYSTSLSGYTRLSGYKLVSMGTKTVEYANFNSGFDTSNSLYKKYYGKKVSSSENDTTIVKAGAGTSTGKYIYWHWCEGKSATTPANHLINWTKSSTYKKFHAFEKEEKKAYKGTSYNAYVFSNAKVCSYNYNWNGYKSKTDGLTTIYTQTYETFHKLYTYEKYSDYSEWKDYTDSVPYSNGQTVGSNTNQTYQDVTTRTVEQKIYRYKVSGEIPDKDSEQTIDSLEYSVSNKYNDKQATVFIYKYTSPSDYTNEYIGVVTVQNGKIVLNDVELREALSDETGDYTVSASIAGNIGMIELGKIEAPKPQYTVNFYDYAEDVEKAQIIYSETITQGDTVVAPDKSEVSVPEGYEFDSWGQSTVNVQDNLNVYPSIKEKEVVVAFVDWGSQTVSMEEYKYGEQLNAPAASEVEGMNVTWDFENASNVESKMVIEGDEAVKVYYVTGNTVITTKEEESQARALFLTMDSEYAINDGEDTDGNILDENINDIEDDKIALISTAGYGDRIDTPSEIEEDEDIIFYGWKNIRTGKYLNDTIFEEGESLENADKIDAIYAPVYEFAESCDVPEASVHTGEYDENKTVELTCTTENAVIYYTTDGSDPEEKGIEYEKPITLTKSTTLKFCAMALGMNNSGTVDEMYAINTETTGTPYHIISIYSDITELEDSYYQVFIKDGTLLNTTPLKTIEGYILEELYLDIDETDVFDEATEPITESIDLYAKYEPIKYKVDFYADGVLLDEQSVDYLQSASAPEAPTKDGKIFTGWDNDDYTCVTSDVVCNATYASEDEYATVSLTKSSLTIMEGMEYTKLKAVITPSELDDTELTWSSSNWGVASVDDEGIITAIKTGTTTITVVVNSTGEKSECTVNVVGNYKTSIVLNEKSYLGMDSAGNLREIDPEKNTVEELKNEFNNDVESLRLYSKDGEELTASDKVGTGTIIKLISDGQELDSMIIVMTGDIDGDGHIGNIDAIRINNWLLEKEELNDEQQLAADVNGDGYVNNKDAAMISRYLVGKESL